MVKLDKIYTRGGDRGMTSLGNGVRVSKQAPRVKAMGAVDEANAALGLCSLHAPEQWGSLLTEIQQDLFDLGADLCLPLDPSSTKVVLRLQEAHVNYLESQIDDLNEQLTPLSSFVVPGGTAFSAHVHMARTLVRRAEREVSALLDSESLNLLCLQYLNRLSDFLFVLARFGNDKGKKDILWTPGKTIRSSL